MPSNLLSQHIECYWDLQLAPGELDSPYEVLAPDCTFDIWFITEAVEISTITQLSSKKIESGVFFIGQKTTSFQLSVKQPTRIFGIRFKPFAFANLIQKPLFQFNDSIEHLGKIFKLTITEQHLLKFILQASSIAEKRNLSEEFMSYFLRSSFAIDQTFRAQLNYILDRKGLIKVNHLFTSFGISKVTLRNHFLSKMGLAPKKVSRIWRINYFLHLQQTEPHLKLTQLCLDAGFYDQAHFIKEFRYFYGISPRQFFQQDSQLLKVAQEIISRRFTNQYDPR